MLDDCSNNSAVINCQLFLILTTIVFPMTRSVHNSVVMVMDFQLDKTECTTGGRKGIHLKLLQHFVESHDLEISISKPLCEQV